MPEIDLRICGLNVRLSADGALCSQARERYRPFLGAGPPDLRLRSARARGSLVAPGVEPRVRSAGGETLVRWDGLALRLRPGNAEAEVAPPVARLDSALRIALCFELLRRGGFLCHAAAVDGWLFPGRSGAGKTTLGRLAPPGRLLSDELVGVRRGRLYGTPFFGEFRPGDSARSHPLLAVILLDRAGPTGARPVSKSEAAVRMLECAFFFGDDAASARRLPGLAKAAVRRVPALALSYDARRTGFGGVRRTINCRLNQ